MGLLIKNAKIIYDDNVSLKDIFIEQGKIIEIGDKLEVNVSKFIDAKENFVFPGLIDTSCKVCDPGFEYKEDIASVSRSAVKGGFTSITASPDTMPVTDNKTVVKYIQTKSQNESLVNIFQYGSMTKGLLGKEMAEIGEMKEAGIVAISDGGKCVDDSSLLNNILKYSVMFDLPVITFCEEKTLAGEGVINKGKISTETGLRGISRAAEEIIVSRNIILSKYNGSKIHISNISTEGSVELIRRAKKDGINITCDTCPHYFTLCENSLRDYNTLLKLKPPLRTEKDKEAIIEGLIDGTIDIISSGHSPSSIEQKKTEFDKADYGISSLETAFITSYDCLVGDCKMNIIDFIDKFTLNPAKMLSLETKGQLKVGYDADLFIFSEEENFINAFQFASKSKFSPYHGLKVEGKILFTVVSGKVMNLENQTYL